MRRTLAVLVTAGAFLVPAGAASAQDVHANASCSNGHGGNHAHQDTHTYNELGNVTRAGSCVGTTTEKTTGWSKNHGGSTDVVDGPVSNDPV